MPASTVRAGDGRGTHHRMWHPNRPLVDPKSLIAYGVRIYPCSTFAESKQTPTIVPPGFIPVATEKVAPGGSNEVKTPLLLRRKECPTPRVSFDSPTIVALGVTTFSKCKRGAREINCDEGSMIKWVSVTVSRIIRVSADDFTGRANSAGSAADRPRRIGACEDAFLGQYKTVESAARR